MENDFDDYIEKKQKEKIKEKEQEISLLKQIFKKLK